MTVSGLDLEVRPGHSLGCFVLGSSLWSVLEILRQKQTVFPQISVSYDASNVATSPILLHLRPFIDLVFSQSHQRLRIISLRQLRSQTSLTLRYKSRILSSTESVLRRIDVSKVLGPTYPGSTMRYPGVWFGFEEDGQQGGKGVSATGDRMQEVRRIVISQVPEDPLPAIDVLDYITPCDAMKGEVSTAIAALRQGLTLHFHTVNNTKAPLHIRIGRTSAQDLLIELGPPLRVFYKEDDRMSIHAATDYIPAAKGGHFYNYFQHGLDFLISDDTHIVQKIIVHSNIPGSPLFQRYKRCPWKILVDHDEESSPVPSIGFQSKPNEVTTFFTALSATPRMRLDRSEDDGLILPDATTNLVGMDGAVFEVTELGQISSFTMF